MHARTYMRSALAATTIAAALMMAAPAQASTGEYLDFGDRPSFVENRIVVIGPEGVPQVNYKWGIEDNPVTVSHWALQNWSWWLRDQQPEHLAPVIKAADWLLGRQREDGAWEYYFDFNALGVPMVAPWISAMTQGMGISVLVRAHEATGEQRYLDAALLALQPFSKSVEDGGVASTWNGRLWYEEYPGAQSQHVLNGFEFSLLGLHDLASQSSDAQRLWDAGISSLIARVGVFDAPAARSQYYAALGGGHILVTGSGYPHEHAVLTRTLADLTGAQNLKDYAARWELYLRPLPVQAKPTAVAPAAPVATTPTVAQCRVRGRAITRRGRISCRRAQRVLRFYIRHTRSPREWRCRGKARARCSRSSVTVSISS